MKQKVLYPLFLGLTITACTPPAESNDPVNKLIEKRDSLKSEIALLNEQIAALDTNELIFPLVTINDVQRKDFVHKVEVQGAVEAEKNALVNSEANGVIDIVHVRAGDKVSKGQALITIDSDILSSTIDEVETSLELATYLYDKQKKLLDEGVGVEIEFEQALNQKKALEKKLKTMNTQQGKTVVRAPFTGIVDEVSVHIGEMAAPGFPLIRLVNNEEVTVSASLSENLLARIKEGSEVELVIPSLNDTTISSVVSSRGNYIDPTNRTFKIRIDIKDNALLLPNQLAKVSVTDYRNDSALVIQSESILQDTKNNNYIYKVIDEKDGSYGLKKVFVKVLKRYKGEACVIPTKGKLSASDQVVLEGAKGITESDRVKLQ